MILLPLRKLHGRIRGWQKYRRFDTCSPEIIPKLREAFVETQGLPGDYYEFGIYKGFLLYKAHQFAGELGLKDMRIFGFDSFEGLPEIKGIDQGGKFTEGGYAYGFDKVKRHLMRHGIDFSKLHLIKGFFSDTLKDPKLQEQYGFTKAKIVVVDCDLYHSTKDVLVFIKPFLQDGTIIFMDDWNCFDADDSKGERRATREFLDQNPQFRFVKLGDFGWHGAFFRVSLHVQ